MALVTFHDLPPEILEQIAQNLSNHKLSLLDFALTSRKCRAASIPSAFADICFKPSALVTLRRNVEHLACTLTSVQAFQYVRRFSISAVFSAAPSEEDGDNSHFLDPGEDGYHSWRLARLPDRKRFREDSIPYRRSPADAYVEHAGWKAFAYLLGQMSGLRDLTWEVSCQFPRCVLNCLHSKLPHCRLHLRTFRFHSLISDMCDPYELQLASSPSLASVWARYDLIYESGLDDFNDQAVMDMVSGLATRLKEVRLYYVRSSLEDHHLHRLQDLRERGHWWSLPGRSCSGKGYLQRLDLVNAPHRYGIDDQCLQQWSTVTDFSVLRTLRLEDPKCSALTWLATNAANRIFPGLKTFILTYHDHPPDHWTCDASQHSENVLAKLLSCMRPLEALQIEGSLDDAAFLAILTSHGGSLRRLKLDSSWLYEWQPFDYKRTRALCASCTQLQELAIPIKRSIGDGHEAEIYKSIGSLPRLQTVQLTLDCADTSLWTSLSNTRRGRARGYEPAEAPSDSTFDDFDNQIFASLARTANDRRERLPRNGHMKHSLINAAVDAQLAFSIWITMLSQKPNGAGNGLPLEQLTLLPDRKGCFATPVRPLEKFYNLIGRAWTVKRSVRDDEPLCATVIPAGPMFDLQEKMQLHPSLVPVFRRLWPRAFQDGGDWRRDWHSFPLVGTEHDPSWVQIEPGLKCTYGGSQKFCATP